MQELSFVRSLFLLLESPGAVAGVCLVIFFWLLKLALKGVKAEIEKSIDSKASKEEVKEIQIELATLKGKLK